MDLGLARDWYQSFMRYQECMRQQFEPLMERFSIERVDGDRSILDVHEDLKSRIEGILAGFAEHRRG
jgi:dTMP kinase